MNIRPLAKLLAERPKTVLLVFTIAMMVVGLQATNIYMESDLTGYLPRDNPAIELWSQIEKDFEMGSTIIIYVEADDVRDYEVLKEMDIVATKINIYENDKGDQDDIFSVRSLASFIKEENAKPYSLGGLGGTGKYEVPEDETLIARYLARPVVQSMKGTLFTNTYTDAVIIIQLSSNANYSNVLSRTKDAIEHRGTFYSDMTITGTIAMQDAIQVQSTLNLLYIFPIAIVFVGAVLFFFHRTIKGIIIAFLPPIFAIALTFGTMGVIHPEMTFLSVAVISLLAGLGVDYSIHIMNRFVEENEIENVVDRMEKTLKSTGKAILLSTITTMIGFGSLMISSMNPIVIFGLSCVIGIFYCFISAIILAPCLSLILKFEKNGVLPLWKQFANFAIKQRYRILAIACFFAVMSLIVIPQIKTDVNYYDMAPEGLSEVEYLQKYSDVFGGGANFNALYIETDYMGLTYPETIEAIYELEEQIREKGATAYSIADELKEYNDVLERSKIIEQLSDLVDADEIIFDMIAEEGIVNEDYSRTILIVSIPVGYTVGEIEQIVDEVNEISAETTIPHNGKVSILTGSDVVNAEINRKLADEQTRSMIIALLLVLAALIIIFNSSIYGFLTMIPVGFVLVWEPGFLVLFDVPLSIVTISIASIMIGIGIDYGVHITQRVREGLADGLSKIESTKIAIEKTGLSLFEAACTTIAAMISIYFINIPALQQFGFIVIVMTASSCIGAALILPVFYNLKREK